MEEYFEIELFLKEGDEFAFLRVREKLENSKFIESFQFISKDSAKTQFIEEYGQEMLDYLDYNPLPSSFKVLPKEKIRTAEYLDRLEKYFAKWSEVDQVTTHMQFIEMFEEWHFKATTILTVVFIGLSFALWFIVRNSVRLSMFSRRALIENMKYCGATNLYIYFPFLVEGIFQGVVASISAGVFWRFALLFLESISPKISSVVMVNFWSIYLLVLFITLLTALSSYRVVQRYLRDDSGI